MGGKESSESITQSVEVYTLLDDEWTETTSMNFKKHHFGVGVLDNKIYTMGGFSGDWPTDELECFDPAINSWTPVARMRETRMGLGVGVLKGALYAVGGYVRTIVPVWTFVKKSVRTVKRYEPRINTYTNVAGMIAKRSLHGVTVCQDQLYSIGGNDDGTSLSSVETYDPHINSGWTIVVFSR